MKTFVLSTAALALLVIASVEAQARKWTDSTGKYSIDGEFVGLTDGQVDLRRDDGKVVRVSLEKLSQVDQEHVRQAAKTMAQESPFAVAAEGKPAAKSKAGEGGNNTQVVFAEGLGTTKEEAIKDAFRAAVRQVVGEVVDGETLVKNETLVKDQVLTYSDGFIPEHKELSTTKENGLFRVSIQARVQRRSLIQKLSAARITLKNLDGQSLYGQVVTEVAAEKDSAALVSKALEGFPEQYLEAKVVGEPKVLKKTDSDAVLELHVEITPNVIAYKTLANRLCKTLEAISKHKGKFSTVSKARSGNRGRAEFVLTEYADNSVMEWMPSVLINNGPYKSAEWQPDTFTYVVATMVSKDCSRIEWRYFVVDPATADAARRAALRAGICEVSFVDSDGQPVVPGDQFDLKVDRIPNPDEGSYTINNWQCFLTKVIGGRKWRFETLTDEHAGSADGQWEPRLAFLAPLVLDNDDRSIKYVPTFPFTRRIKLSHEELKRISKVTAEISFRDKAGEKDRK